MFRDDAAPGADARATYEFTVCGEIGPAARHALRPQSGPPAELCTILRAEVRDETDLVDLVRIIESRGLDLDGVFALGRGHGEGVPEAPDEISGR